MVRHGLTNAAVVLIGAAELTEGKSRRTRPRSWCGRISHPVLPGGCHISETLAFYDQPAFSEDRLALALNKDRFFAPKVNGR